MSSVKLLERRAFLKGIGGVALALPVLDAMGAEVAEAIPRRFCALYTANGMSLPRTEHGIDEWSWFPRADKDGQFVFGKSTEPLSPFRNQLSFLGGLYHQFAGIRFATGTIDWVARRFQRRSGSCSVR